MDFDDYGGSLGGGLGGLVRWQQGPHPAGGVRQDLAAAVTSVACGVGFGYLTQAVIQWQWPAVPHTVAIGCSFVAGLASGVLSQTAVAVVSDVAARLRVRIADRLAPPAAPHGPTPAPGPDPAPPVRPAPHPAPVRGVDADQLRAAGADGGRAEATGGRAAADPRAAGEG